MCPCILKAPCTLHTGALLRAKTEMGIMLKKMISLAGKKLEMGVLLDILLEM